jgi:hypothetical protein
LRATLKLKKHRVFRSYSAKAVIISESNDEDRVLQMDLTVERNVLVKVYVMTIILAMCTCTAAFRGTVLVTGLTIFVKGLWTSFYSQ